MKEQIEKYLKENFSRIELAVSGVYASTGLAGICSNNPTLMGLGTILVFNGITGVISHLTTPKYNIDANRVRKRTDYFIANNGDLRSMVKNSEYLVPSNEGDVIDTLATSPLLPYAAGSFVGERLGIKKVSAGEYLRELDDVIDILAPMAAPSSLAKERYEELKKVLLKRYPHMGFVEYLLSCMFQIGYFPQLKRIGVRSMRDLYNYVQSENPVRNDIGFNFLHTFEEQEKIEIEPVVAEQLHRIPKEMFRK